jgi:hypothetical protein
MVERRSGGHLELFCFTSTFCRPTTSEATALSETSLITRSIGVGDTSLRKRRYKDGEIVVPVLLLEERKSFIRCEQANGRGMQLEFCHKKICGELPSSTRNGVR